MQLDNLSNYFDNPDNMHSMHVWKIAGNKNIFEVEKNSINFIKLNYVKSIKGIISHESISINSISNDSPDNLSFSNVNNFSFVSNDNLEDITNNFYLLSFDRNINNLKNLFVISNESFKSILPESTDLMWVLNLQNLETLTNINPNKIILDTNFDYSFLNSIDLIFKNNIFLQSISVIGDLKNDKNGEILKNQPLNLKIANNISFAPNFISPTSVSKLQNNYYFSTFNDSFLIDLRYFANNIGATGEVSLLSFFQNDNKPIEIIKDLIDTTKKIMNNFAGMNEEQIRKFKETKFNGNDPQQYCDFKIQEYLTSLNIVENKVVAIKFRSVIIALSEFIKSSYCWNGGLTEEHKFGLLWFLDFIDNKFYLKSIFLNISNFSNKWNGILSLNSINEFGKILSFPQVPKELEETIITNSPIDFNSKSFNLNYLFWTPLSTKEKLKKFYHPDNIPTTSIQNEYTIDLPNGSLSDADIENLIKRQKGLSSLSNMIRSTLYRWNRQVEYNCRTNSYGYGRTCDYRTEYFARATFQEKIVATQQINRNWLSNKLDYKLFLQSRNLWENINLNLKIEDNFANSGYKIQKIKKVVLKGIFLDQFYINLNTLNNTQSYFVKNDFLENEKILELTINF